ncbi:hypothetical protein OIU76_025100 [Salix suchowensis]|nr:hypothetical protein OIU76_025100 [Salix suchowensis]
MRLGFLNGVLAFTKSIPQLDCLIPGSRNDLPVIYRESNRQHILGVANESASRDTRCQVPETELSVPGTGQSKLDHQRIGQHLGRSGSGRSNDGERRRRFFHLWLSSKE